MVALRRKHRIVPGSSVVGNSTVGSIVGNSTVGNSASSTVGNSAGSNLGNSAVGSNVDIVTVLSSSSSESSYKSNVVLREGRARFGTTGDKARRRMSSVFTSDSARKKWRNFEKKVS